MNPPLFTPVTSSNIASYLYLVDRQQLLIAFKSGGVYAYSRVPQSVATDFGNAESKGKFFQTEIKPRFDASAKLGDAELAELLSGASATQVPRRKPRVTFESLIRRHPILTAVF